MAQTDIRGMSVLYSYRMDVESLGSSSPGEQHHLGQFSHLFRYLPSMRFHYSASVGDLAHPTLNFTGAAGLEVFTLMGSRVVQLTFKAINVEQVLSFSYNFPLPLLSALL